VLIDVRRTVSLGVSDERAVLVVPTPKPPPGTAFPPRRLTLRGVPIFELNLWCKDLPGTYYEHWVLTHFLLDGHHKIEAAARAGGSVRLLSLVDERIGIAAVDDLTALVGTRSQPAETRSASR